MILIECLEEVYKRDYTGGVTYSVGGFVCVCNRETGRNKRRYGK